MANVVDDEFEQLLLRVKMANERSALFSTSADFFKNIQYFGPDRCRSIQMAFLNKIEPSLFRHITENEFNSMFSQLFLQSTAVSLTTLIQFLSLISKKEQLKFCKLIQLIRLVQNKLLSKALLPRNDRHNHNEEQQLHQMPADHFAFLLCSFPERVYNFVGCSDQSAASIVNSFEDSLFDTLLQSLDECVQHQSSGLSIELFARILSDYNSISEEFTGRFLAAILEKQQEELHSLLQQIFTFNLIDRRKREKLILVLIQLAPDAQKLQILFGDSVISDKLLRKCLLDKAILLSTAEHSVRHSKKAANYLAAIGQPHLVSAFRELIQRFSAQCQIAELISLGSQFQLSLAIVDFAHKISPELRSAMREELADTLVPAFPQLLQQMDTSRRQIGMFLAETLFSLFNIESPPKFDYIEGDPLLQEFITAVNEAKEAEECSNGRVEEQTGKAEREATTAKVMGSRPRRGPIDPRVALLDSDDEEEAEQQIARTDEGNAGGDEAEDSDDGQPGPSQRRPPFPYLRDCLEALHSQQEDRQLWEAALKAILPMVRRRALAMDVLAVQLLETVLFLDNKFNTPHFGTIRENILKEVLASKPELVSHVARLSNSRSCSMAHRYLLLSAIVGAAKLLSGTEESNGDGQKPSKVKLALEEESGSKMNSTASGTQGPKVTWKSERLMAKNPEEVTSKADAFAAAAPQFAFPLLDLCTRIRPEQDSPLLGKTIWAIGQVLGCARNSPSILRITSAILSCLRHQQRAPQNIFVLTNCILCYSAIIHTVKAELLKTHFAEELNQLWEWLTKLQAEERERIEANEPLKHSIALLFFELSKL